MVVFIWDEFEVLITIWSIRRALQREGWSKKAAKQKAKERNADLRDACY
jgi:transposase